jgi:hypothetical protein
LIIDGNEIADQLARQHSSPPPVGSEPALDISAKVARGVIRDWKSRKHEEHWQSIHGQKQTKGFLKKTLCKKNWQIAQSEQKPAKNIDRYVNRTLSVKRTFVQSRAGKQSQV